MSDTPAWREYELQIAEHLRTLGGDEAQVEFDVRVEGKLSGTPRQVDVRVTGRFAGGIDEDVTAVVDCKDYTRNVTVERVEAFLGWVDDVGADLAFLITSSSYSPAAKRRAKAARGVRLHEIPRIADVVSVDELATYRLPYYESSDEAYYAADSWDHEPYGGRGETIVFGDDEGGTEVISEGDASWGDPESNRDVAATILQHRYERQPSEDEVELFLAELGGLLVAGDMWVIWVGQLGRAGL